MRHITAILIGRVGDVIVSTPMLRALKAKFPDAKVKLIVSRPTLDAAALIPFVSKVETMGAALMGLAVDPCDLAVDLNPSFSRTSTALMLALRKAPVRLGFQKRKWSGVFTQKVAAPKDDEPMLSRYARMAEALGCPYEARTELRLRAADEAGADRLLKAIPASGKRRVLIHAGNFKKFDNRWPEESFVVLGNILQQLPDVEPIFLAGPGELEPVTAIAKALMMPAPVVGPASLGVTGALMKRMELVVLNITGTTHLAAALGVPTFGLYAGYTNAVWHPPGRLHHGVVAKSWTSCRDISVDEVWAALSPLLKNGTQ